ncbi:MAG: inositol 2-dehydrogenase [Pseudomonadota bacterium]
MRVAILGAGRIGQVHAPNVDRHPGSQIAAIADPISEAGTALALRYGARVMSEAEIMADPEIDAVLIASSTDRHADQAEAAARSGKAIFCEKPVDLSLERVRRVEAVLAAHPVPFMLGFNRRFDPNFAALKAQIDAGAIGKVEMITILSRDPAPPPLDYIRVSGGLFRDMMIHDFDIARWLAGAEFIDVAAMGAVHVDPAIAAAGDVDTAAVTLKTASGILASISNSRRAAYGYDQRIEVHGSHGMVSAENMRETTMVLSTPDGIRFEKPKHFFLERYETAYAREWAAFVDLVATGKAHAPGIEDGLASLELAERALASASAHR